MTLSDDELLAYVDGEIAEDRRATVEREIAADPVVARRVAAQRALRAKLHQAFDGVLDEPVPPRLLAAARSSSVVHFPGAASRETRRPRHIARWLAAAASVVLGIFVAQQIGRLAGAGENFASQHGGVVAAGELEDVLSRKLTSEQSPSDRIRVMVSFLADSGDYCRTFVVVDKIGSDAGIACREGDVWHVRALESMAGGTRDSGQYRPAATLLPPLIVQAMQASMVGDALDAQGESAARRNDWRRPAVRQPVKPAP